MSLPDEPLLTNEYENLTRQFIAARSGNEQAYEEFLKMLQAQIERYLRRSPIEASQKNDITQDVLLSVHLARHTYDPAKPLGPWLVAIIRRRLIDSFRVSKRFVAEDIENHLDLTSKNNNVDDTILLEEALASLDDKRRAAVVGSEIDGYSTSEMASKFGMQHGAFRVMLHRTLKNLRKTMEV